MKKHEKNIWMSFDTMIPEEYLRQISQCLFNLKEIVNTQKIAPAKEFKKLHWFFGDEKDKLSYMLDAELIPLDLSDISFLEGGFLLDNGKSDFTKKQYEETTKYLINSLDKIQNMREYTSEITTGVEEGELKEYLDRLYNESKSVKENKEEKRTKVFKFKHKLPAGTRWENFIFVFVDPENLKVKIGDKTETLNYKDLELDSKKNDKPTIPWVFFYILAQHNGEITPTSPSNRGSFKKAKQALAETLKSFFSIDYDPFYPYHTSEEKRGNSYKSKFTVFCENTNTEKEMNPEEKSFFEQQMDDRNYGYEIEDN